MKKIFKSFHRVVILAVVLSLVAVPAAVLADWNPGDCSKWEQLPDLSEFGLDIRASANLIPPPLEVADDFLCTESGFITDIHIWGSYFEDVPAADKVFDLRIYADIPDPDPGNPETWSMPGALLWSHQFAEGEFIERLYAGGLQELFYDPYYDEIMGPDHECYQFNFYIDPADAFYQEAGDIYWLSVIKVASAGCVWGWKTSESQWNDDAVYSPEPGYGGPWFALTHPEFGHSLDMAFVLTTDTGTIILEKQTLPDGETEWFDILEYPIGLPIVSLQDDDTQTFNCLTPGTYQMIEDVPSCWDVTVDIVEQDGIDNSSVDPGTGLVTLNLEAGETIHVTFNNTKRGYITIEKQTDPDGSSSTFNFDGVLPATLGDGGTITSPCLPPGSYTGWELTKANWELVDINIQEGPGTPSTYDFSARKVFFKLDPGETVKAIFTNRYVPPPEEPPGEDHGAAVGIEVYPVDKIGLIAPWIALAVVIIAGGVVLLMRRRAHS